MSQLQSSVIAVPSMPRTDLNPRHSTTATTEQIFQPSDSMDSVLPFTTILEYAISQPGLADTLNKIYCGMGLGQNVSVAFANAAKRGIERVSDPETLFPSKRSKLEKSRQPGLGQTNRVNHNSSVGKDLKEWLKVECFCCRVEYCINQFPKLLPSVFCSHGREMCRHCNIQWIRQQCQDGIIPRCAQCLTTMRFAFVESITGRKCDEDIFIR